MRNRLTLFLLLLGSALSGCGPLARERVTFQQLVGPLGDPARIARLDELETAFISSSDPTGGNRDFNRPLRVTEDGWWIIADLKGPGYISRFWFTTSDHNHKIRLYFDNERTPRIETTVRKFFGGMEPFLPPFAAFENLCYYNYVPIPYARRLVIMVEAGGYEPGNWPRVFHQINYSSLPGRTAVDSLEIPPADGVMEALQAAAETWTGHGDAPSRFAPSCEAGTGREQQIRTVLDKTLDLRPSSSAALPVIEGPAMIRKIGVTPVPTEAVPVPDGERFLRDIVVRIRWDGSDEYSVSSPLGDLFGSVWQRVPYESLYFGLRGDMLISRFPMPFEGGAEISFENQGDYPFKLNVEADIIPIEWDGSLGYFHAAWRRSSAHDVGRPHEILDTKGSGRFAGCILSVTSLDKSFWILEGDEVMWRDGEPEPFWDGTGLEDYFNGGWYYQNVLSRPLHGLPFKTFFRTVQYRMHLPDAVMFQNAFRMIFERGPHNNSRGWMESTAWYYMARPGHAPSSLMTARERRPPEDQFGQVAVMPELFNFEHFNDYQGARRFIDRFLERYPDSPFAGMLRLRRAAYTEKIEGIEAARPLYEKIIVSSENETVREQAESLIWFHENRNHALLGVYAFPETRVFLNGRLLKKVGDPGRMEVSRVKLQPGRHALALLQHYGPYPFWVQAFLRTHNEDIVTSPDWQQMHDPSPASMHDDDGGWVNVGWTSVKGPPDEPYIWVEPNAFVDMQTRAMGIGPTIDWHDRRRPMGFRKIFDFPR